MKAYFILIALIYFCSISTIAQEIPIPDSLIGTWKYKGTDQINISDTIELEKGSLKDSEYELWTFRPYRNRLEIKLKPNSKGPGALVITRIESWFYDKNSNILKIGENLHEFKIVTIGQHSIKLIRIK